MGTTGARIDNKRDLETCEHLIVRVKRVELHVEGTEKEGKGRGNGKKTPPLAGAKTPRGGGQTVTPCKKKEGFTTAVNKKGEQFITGGSEGWGDCWGDAEEEGGKEGKSS